MDNTDESRDLADAYSRPAIDEFYRRLVERFFAQDDSEVIMLTVAQKNILAHDNRRDCPQCLADGHLRSDGEMKRSLKLTWRTSWIASCENIPAWVDNSPNQA